MLWVVGGIGALWLAFVSPSFRKVALVIIGLAAVVGLWLYSLEKKNEADRKRLAELIPRHQVVLSDVNVQNDYGSDKIVGTVRNNSNHDIESMTVSYEIFDCQNEKTLVERCLSIGKDENIYLSGEVPSGSARSFDGYMTLTNVAAASGFRKSVYDLGSGPIKGIPKGMLI